MTHMWRYFVRRIGADVTTDGDANFMNWCACNDAYRTFTPDEQKILREYFMADWGEDLNTVANMASRLGIPAGAIWQVIRRAIRSSAVYRGLIDGKERKHETDNKSFVR